MRGADNNTGLKVNTVTVVGANGTMGRNVSAIFASFGHAKVYMVSRDIRKSEAARDKAYQSVRAESVKNNMYPADYSMLEDCVKESDIVFESSAENWEVKSTVTAQIAEAASKHVDECRDTVFCTGSSGLSITDLSEILPEELRGNYMGMHMFNPPYSMTLCEMTPTVHSNRELFEAAKADPERGCAGATGFRAGKDGRDSEKCMRKLSEAGQFRGGGKPEATGGYYQQLSGPQGVGRYL